MKLKQMILLTGLGLAMTGCQPHQAGRPAESAVTAARAMPLVPPEGSVLYTLSITGMHCDGCAAGLTSELARVPGVSHAVVDLKSARAQVICETNRVTLSQVLAAVEEAGFRGSVVER